MEQETSPDPWPHFLCVCVSFLSFQRVSWRPGTFKTSLSWFTDPLLSGWWHKKFSLVLFWSQPYLGLYKLQNEDGKHISAVDMWQTVIGLANMVKPHCLMTVSSHFSKKEEEWDKWLQFIKVWRTHKTRYWRWSIAVSNNASSWVLAPLPLSLPYSLAHSQRWAIGQRSQILSNLIMKKWLRMIFFWHTLR